MKRYNKYKDSGIPWLGQIPEHWEVRIGKRIYSANDGGVWGDDPDGDNDTIVLRSTEQTEDGNLQVINPAKRKLSPRERISGMLLEGDLIITKSSGSPSHIGKTSLIDKSTELLGCCYSNFIQRVRVKGSPRFYWYVFNSQFVRGQFQNLSTTTTGLGNLSGSMINNILLPLPPLSEQAAIVSYLDRKVSDLDSFVSKQETQISYLKELKQATIAKAVTRGIDPSVALKDSGIPWLGQIPEHWEVDKLGLHFQERNEKVSDKDYPALSVSKEGITLQLDRVAKTENGDNRKKVCKGDFVANSRSDRKGSCGFSDYEGSVSLISIVITPLGLNPKFYHFLFRSHNYIEEFYRLGRGIVADLWTTRYIDMKNIMIPLPPMSEQEAIVSYLEEKLGAIDRLIAASEAAIARVRELKQTLIADVVTGRICVQSS